MDNIDRRLLALLREDARATIASLAKQVGSFNRTSNTITQSVRTDRWLMTVQSRDRCSRRTVAG